MLSVSIVLINPHLALGDVREEELCCFLQIDQFILKSRNALIITINGENGQVFFKSSGSNKRINIANILMQWPESAAKISIAF